MSAGNCLAFCLVALVYEELCRYIAVEEICCICTSRYVNICFLSVTL